MEGQAMWLTFFALPLIGQAAAAAGWCYTSQSASCGPEFWKTFSHNCGGENQSPVNIDRAKISKDKSLGDIVFGGYDQAPPGKWRIMNDGHTVLVSLDGDNTPAPIDISGAGLPNVYRALQFHFHWGSLKQDGSEHYIDGKQYPMELHIVHLSAKYKSIADAKADPNGLAVLGLLFRVTPTDNANYNTIVDAMKNVTLEGESVDLASTFRLDSLLPSADKLSRYYRYQGSLTTPDCAEAVIWTVFEEPVNISRSQLNVFVDSVHFTATGEERKKMTNNFRPPQPLRNRKISASRDATANRGTMRGTSLPALLLTFLIGQHMVHAHRLS
ncbi:carbonic anhydrase 15-like [Ambystoma mexicanum]|uniref:carbonic anhydrase 15-like n=1 Tax=Ambystoma mexicanum TaxID=8296 RepID=UPI0037E86CC4